jgi:hypothetical protein
LGGTDWFVFPARSYRAYSPVMLYGEMDTSIRDRSVKAFRRDRQVQLLIANPAAAREGLTLTEANVAIYLDRTFNLVDYLQSQDRIHRISQTRPCDIVLSWPNRPLMNSSITAWSRSIGLRNSPSRTPTKSLQPTSHYKSRTS